FSTGGRFASSFSSELSAGGPVSCGGSAGFFRTAQYPTPAARRATAPPAASHLRGMFRQPDRRWTLFVRRMGLVKPVTGATLIGWGALLAARVTCGRGGNGRRGPRLGNAGDGSTVELVCG